MDAASIERVYSFYAGVYDVPAERFAEAVNTDVLVPRPVGRFVFGRLAAAEGGRLQLLPPAPGSRQVIVADPPWIAKVSTLIRRL